MSTEGNDPQIQATALAQSLPIPLASPYTPLDHKIPQIRVFKLLPSSDWNSQIEGRLLSVPIHGTLDSDRYEAVSYTWGVTKYTSHILLNGHSFQVKRSLEAMLRYLRYPSAERTLWIDALCINQLDATELNHQVPLMKEIFSRCTRCVAWMVDDHWIYDSTEEEYDNSIQARTVKLESGIKGFGEIYLSFITAIGTNSQETTSDTPPSSNEAPKNTESVDDPLATLHGLIDKHEPNLQLLFNNSEIWSRIWTMQELVNARNVSLTAGNHMVPFEAASIFLQSGIIAGELHNVPAGHITWGDALTTMTYRGFKKVNSLRRQVWGWIPENGIVLRSPQYDSKLWDILDIFHTNEATNPRDYIYGFLGLVNEKHQIMVDYTKTPVEVFEDATISMINTSRNLDILCQVASPSMKSPDDDHDHVKHNGVPGLPSWTPDFTRQVSFGEKSKILFAGRDIFSAGMPQVQNTEPLKVVCGCFLPLTVVFIDEYIMDRPAPSDKHSLILRRLPQHWLDEYKIDLESLLNTTNKYSITGETKFEAYFRTLWLDCKCEPLARLDRRERINGQASFKAILRHEPADFDSGDATPVTMKEMFPEEWNTTKNAALKALRELIPSSNTMKFADIRAITSPTGEDLNGNNAANEDQENAKQILQRVGADASIEEAMESWLAEDFRKGHACTDEEKFLEKLWDTLPARLRDMWFMVGRSWQFVPTKNDIFTMVRSIQAGDTIAVADGAKVPLILRPEGNFDGMRTYSLVGTAYVHGFMDGEVEKMVDDGQFKKESILLQ